MFRFRHLLSVAVIAAVMSSMPFGVQAQPPGGGGPGGGGPGGGGPGGRGPRGVPGGPGSTLSLALNAVIQAELKVKEAQKTKIQALAEELNQRQQQLRDQFAPPNQNNRRNRNNG